MDFDQTCTETSLGHGKEMIRMTKHHKSALELPNLNVFPCQQHTLRHTNRIQCLGVPHLSSQISSKDKYMVGGTWACLGYFGIQNKIPFCFRDIGLFGKINKGHMAYMSLGY